MEDLDHPRMKAGMEQQAIDDLRWLSLDWDEGPDLGGPGTPYTQSECDPFYEEAFRELQTMDLVYPCFCSRKEWQAVASAPHGKTAAYPGTCRDLTEHSRNKRMREGKQCSWRIRVDAVEIEFEDQLTGICRQNLTHEVGDFVLKRADGLFAYQLAVVVDDARMGITEVVRGADLLDSTPRQIYLQQILGLPHPEYWHVPLMCDASGQRMAKRDGSDSLESLRSVGMGLPQVIESMLAGCPGLEGVDMSSSQTILRTWDLQRFRHSMRQRQPG